MIPLGVLGASGVSDYGPWQASASTPGAFAGIDLIGWSGTKWWSNYSTGWYYSTDITLSFTTTSSFTVTKHAGGWEGGSPWLPNSLPMNGDWCMTTGAFDTVLKFYDDSANTMNTATLPASQIWGVPRYGNGLWVACGHQTSTATSTDGITWTAKGSSAINGIHPVWSVDDSKWYGFSASGVVEKVDPSDGSAWTSIAGAAATSGPQHVFALNDGTGRFVMAYGGNLFEVYVDGTAVRQITSANGYGTVVVTPTKLLAFPASTTVGTQYREFVLGTAGSIEFDTVTINPASRIYIATGAYSKASYGNGYLWHKRSTGTFTYSRRTQA